MKIGAENKKETRGAGRVWSAGGVPRLQQFPGWAASSGDGHSAPAAERAVVSPPPEAAAGIQRAPARVRSEDWHPVVHAKRPEDRVDPASVDPTLRLDLLAKLQAVPAAGSGRNLFAMSAEPPKLPDHAEPIVKVADNHVYRPAAHSTAAGSARTAAPAADHVQVLRHRYGQGGRNAVGVLHGG